jgi:hypothetical protein
LPEEQVTKKKKKSVTELKKKEGRGSVEKADE